MDSSFSEVLSAGQATNREAAKYWGVGISGLIGVFVIAHWTRKIWIKNISRTTGLGRMGSTIVSSVRRSTKPLAVGGTLVLPGRIWLALAYLAINLATAFTNVNWAMAELFFAKRMGWITLCNLCLSVLLGVRNTPLSPLAGRSYEKLNLLHQVCGYTTIASMVLHSTIHISALFKYTGVYLLRDVHQISAAVAGLSMLIILASILIRKRQYEMFYVIHTVFVIIILITVTYHTYQPDVVTTRTLGVTLLAICLYVVDRTLRLSRWIYYSFGNYAILTPLPEGATRVSLRRPIAAAPGSHAFLYIPGVRALETHPFSLLATQPVEFVIKAKEGFTKSLHATALASNGRKFRAAVEGPYGNVPNVLDYDRLLMIAGGSGATFALSMALAWARQPERRRPGSSLEFVWAIQTKNYLQWFEAELAELRSCAAVALNIHVTRTPVVKEESSATFSESPIEDAAGDRKEVDLDAQDYDARRSSSTMQSLKDNLHAGRPDVDYLVDAVSRGMALDQSVLVAVAGPDMLMADTRLAGARCRRADGPRVTIHTEEFGS